MAYCVSGMKTPTCIDKMKECKLYLKLSSHTGEVFELELKAIKEIAVLRDMLELCPEPDYKEVTDWPTVPLPKLESDSLRAIIEWAHALVYTPKNWEAYKKNFLQRHKKILLRLIRDADYLEFDSLRKVLSQSVAQDILKRNSLDMINIFTVPSAPGATMKKIPPQPKVQNADVQQMTPLSLCELVRENNTQQNQARDENQALTPQNGGVVGQLIDTLYVMGGLDSATDLSVINIVVDICRHEVLVKLIEFEIFWEQRWEEVDSGAELENLDYYDWEPINVREVAIDAVSLEDWFRQERQAQALNRIAEPEQEVFPHMHLGGLNDLAGIGADEHRRRDGNQSHLAHRGQSMGRSAYGQNRDNETDEEPEFSEPEEPNVIENAIVPSLENSESVPDREPYPGSSSSIDRNAQAEQGPAHLLPSSKGQ